MATTLKFKDGPMKGQAMAVQHTMYPGATLEIQGVKNDMRVDRWSDIGPFSMMELRRGTYVATHVTLKNGDVVCKWIGWNDGTF